MNRGNIKFASSSETTFRFKQRYLVCISPSSGCNCVVQFGSAVAVVTAGVADSSVFSVVSRYGGISVGGQLPVLELQPKTIQDVAGQLGQLLNVTGVCL